MKLSDEFAARTPPDDRTHSHDAHDHESGADASRSEPSDGNGRADGSGERAGSSDRVLQSLVELVGEITGSARSLIEVYKDRVRLSARRTIVRISLGVAASLCAAVWLGAAMLAVLRGLCGGLASAFGGREWLGELSGGLLALGVTVAAIAIHLRFSSRREIERLNTKYEGIRNEHANHVEAAHESDDSRSAA